MEEEATEFEEHKLNSAELAKFDRLSKTTAKLQTAVKAEAGAMKVSSRRPAMLTTLGRRYGSPVLSRAQLEPGPSTRLHRCRGAFLQSAKDELTALADAPAGAAINGKSASASASFQASSSKKWQMFSEDKKKELMASWMGGSMTVFNAIFKNEMKLESMPNLSRTELPFGRMLACASFSVAFFRPLRERMLPLVCR